VEKSTRNHEEVEKEFMELKRRHSALVAQLAGKSAESSQQTVKLVNKSAENESFKKTEEPFKGQRDNIIANAFCSSYPSFSERREVSQREEPKQACYIKSVYRSFPT
jgi:hypothetical protein